MIFKYRVIGRAKSQFGFRGMVIQGGTKIDFCIKERDLDFFKEYCDIEQLIDFEAENVVDLPKTILNSEKGVDNGRRNKGNGTRGNSNRQQRANKEEC